VCMGCVDNVHTRSILNVRYDADLEILASRVELCLCAAMTDEAEGVVWLRFSKIACDAPLAPIASEKEHL
jgi:hypothetical protein